MASQYYWGPVLNLDDQVDPAGVESLWAHRSSLTLVLDQIEAYPHRPSSGARVTPSSDLVAVCDVVGYDVNVLIKWVKVHCHCATYVAVVAETFHLLEVFL